MGRGQVNFWGTCARGRRGNHESGKSIRRWAKGGSGKSHFLLSARGSFARSLNILGPD